MDVDSIFQAVSRWEYRQVVFFCFPFCFPCKSVPTHLLDFLLSETQRVKTDSHTPSQFLFSFSFCLEPYFLPRREYNKGYWHCMFISLPLPYVLIGRAVWVSNIHDTVCDECENKVCAVYGKSGKYFPIQCVWFCSRFLPLLHSMGIRERKFVFRENDIQKYKEKWKLKENIISYVVCY